MREKERDNKKAKKKAKTKTIETLENQHHNSAQNRTVNPPSQCSKFQATSLFVICAWMSVLSLVICCFAHKVLYPSNLAPIQFEDFFVIASPSTSLRFQKFLPKADSRATQSSNSKQSLLAWLIRYKILQFCLNPAGDSRVLGFRALNANPHFLSKVELVNQKWVRVTVQRCNPAHGEAYFLFSALSVLQEGIISFVSALNVIELLPMDILLVFYHTHPLVKDYFVYKRRIMVSYYNTPKISFIYSCVIPACFLQINMSTPPSFKNALLGSPKPINNLPSGGSLNANLSQENESVGMSPVQLNVAATPLDLSSPTVQDPPSFTESCVLDDLPQVQKDISELSKSCLLAKMLSAPLDIRTIISRTKADWRVVKGDVDYLEMGNGWILLRFANPQDLALVWSERPWHIQGDLLVLQPWKPSFDPYLEEIRWVDLWVRIPRLPTELLNFDSIANMLAANDIGALIKLDQRSLLRNKIRFARACVRVDIQGPLLEFAEVSRSGDIVHGYVIWYEDFSSGCSFCGEIAHLIDVCPLLNSPKKDLTIQLLKNPKQHTLYKTLAMAAGQVPNNTTAEPARVVCVKPKHLSKKPAAAPVKAKNVLPSNASGILPLPSGKNSNHGIVIKDSVGHTSIVPPPSCVWERER